MRNWIKPYEAAGILKLDIFAFNNFVGMISISRFELAQGKYVYDEEEIRKLRRSMLINKL